MAKEQREVIDRLEKLVRLRKSKNTIKYDNCICSTEDLDTVLSLIKEQTDRINYLESNRKQVKEQVEAAQLELSFAIDMLTDI